MAYTLAAGSLTDFLSKDPLPLPSQPLNPDQRPVGPSPLESLAPALHGKAQTEPARFNQADHCLPESRDRGNQ